MPYKTITLDNGIKLIHKKTDLPVSHFGVLVNAGTRDEKEGKEGLAHFVEHTIFKGTTKRKSYQILRRMEDVGGDINASTSKEETWFHSSFLSSDYERAIELLSDIFYHSVFPEKELERERDVVCEEIKYYKDTPTELLFDDFETQIYQGHPLGRSILGTSKSVKSLKREDILDFIKTQYTADNIVLASVGNISEKKLNKLCNDYFGKEPLASQREPRKPFLSYLPSQLVRHKRTNQAHLVLGIPAYSLYDSKRIPFMLMTNLLGGQGLNTRLNLLIREKLGLAYSVEANYSLFSDSGLFTVYIGCDNHTREKCVELVFSELEKLKRNGIGTMQLHYAKKQFIGQLAISNESKLTEMLSIGRNALFFEAVLTLEEQIEIIEKISKEEIWSVANEIFIQENFSSLSFIK